MHGNFDFKFVREILYAPPIQPRERHIVIKNACQNIHATRKNSTQADRVHTNVSIHVEKNADPEISVRTHF
jgi:hypothetical protein